MSHLIRLGKIAATVGGAAWVIKSLAIVAMNDHFQPMEGVLYFAGVGGILMGAIGLGALVAIRWTGPARWLGFVVVLALVAVITSVASSAVQNAVADAYTGGNVGIEEEMGILTPGVIWLAVGVYLMTRRKTPEVLSS